MFIWKLRQDLTRAMIDRLTELFPAGASHLPIRAAETETEESTPIKDSSEAQGTETPETNIPKLEFRKSLLPQWARKIAAPGGNGPAKEEDEKGSQSARTAIGGVVIDNSMLPRGRWGEKERPSTASGADKGHTDAAEGRQPSAVSARGGRWAQRLSEDGGYALFAENGEPAIVTAPPLAEATESTALSEVKGDKPKESAVEVKQSAEVNRAYDEGDGEVEVTDDGHEVHEEEEEEEEADAEGDAAALADKNREHAAEPLFYDPVKETEEELPSVSDLKEAVDGEVAPPRTVSSPRRIDLRKSFTSKFFGEKDGKSTGEPKSSAHMSLREMREALRRRDQERRLEATQKEVDAAADKSTERAIESEETATSPEIEAQSSHEERSEGEEDKSTSEKAPQEPKEEKTAKTISEQDQSIENKAAIPTAASESMPPSGEDSSERERLEKVEEPVEDTQRTSAGQTSADDGEKGSLHDSLKIPVTTRESFRAAVDHFAILRVSR